MKTKKYKIMANAKNAIGIHNGSLIKHVKTDIQAHTLVCFDNDANYVKTCSAKDLPWGIAQQNASQAHPLISILPLSCNAETACLKIEGTVKAGQYLCLSDNGLVKALPETDGKYTVLGLALTDGNHNDLIEALTTLPYIKEIIS